MTYLRKHLTARLFLSYLAVILIGIVILFSATRLSVPAAFNRHMRGMPGMNDGLGLGQGGGMLLELYHNFRASFNEALAYAGMAAVIVSLLASVYFSRRIIAPLKAMMLASQSIIEGHFNNRVQVSSSDELGQLADRFNKMAEQLEQTEVRRRQLIGDVSHELRTPLTAIKASMEGLVDGVLPSNPDTFVQIQKEAERLSRLVDDLQELSRIESKAYDLELQPLAIIALVKTTLKRLDPQVKKKHIIVNLDLADDLPLVQVDEDRVVQILMNLVGNALSYTPQDGEISIAGVRVKEFLRISIMDTGIGILPEHLPHIFDRFYRVDKSRSRRDGGGSGIGLTISKSLVEAHGGTIWAESSGEGAGSSFSFTLPLA
jgi:two-component system sensor histidine kinase BaeS